MLTQQLLKVATTGGEWILWLLLGLSFLSIGVIVDRWWFFRRRRVDMDALGGALLGRLAAGDRGGAVQLLSSHLSVEAGIVRRCLEWLEDGPDSVSEVLQAALQDARPKLEKGTVLLGTIGNNAPFVGLLGTVLGVVHAFGELADNPTGAMGTVMAGIGEALVATAVGILVALPAVVAYNVFTTRAADVEERASALVSLVLAHQKSARADRKLADLGRTGAER